MRNASEKTVLLLSTSLPLAEGEATIEERLQGGGPPAPIYERLEQHYAPTPVPDLATLDASDGGLLLLAQPRALRPGELAALDAWLRRGGRALILADPALIWPSRYPLGDVRRPVFTSLLSPLLSHWGIELVHPMDEAQGRRKLTIDGLLIETATPGAFLHLPLPGAPAADCMLVADGLLADCTLGKGRAILLADADFLRGDYWAGGAMGGLGGDKHDNALLLEALLNRLQGQ